MNADSSQFPPHWLFRFRWDKGKKKGKGKGAKKGAKKDAEAEAEVDEDEPAVDGQPKFLALVSPSPY